LGLSAATKKRASAPGYAFLSNPNIAEGPPGETVPLHTHRWPSALYVRIWSDFVRRDAEGSMMVDSRTITKVPEESALWSGPLPPHTLENVGASELRAISVELKNVR
jgi:hypothetical protein